MLRPKSKPTVHSHQRLWTESIIQFIMYRGEGAAESSWEVQAGAEAEESEAALYKTSVSKSASTAATGWLTAVINTVIDSIE